MGKVACQCGALFDENDHEARQAHVEEEHDGESVMWDYTGVGR